MIRQFFRDNVEFLTVMGALITLLGLVCYGLARELRADPLTCANPVCTTTYMPITQKVGDVFITNNLPLRSCKCPEAPEVTS